MTLRTKALCALLALATAATVLIGALAYIATGQQLSAEIDTSLREVATYAASQGDGHGGGHADQLGAQFQTVLVQTLNADGSVLDSPTGVTVPVSDADRAVAAGPQTRSVYRDVQVAGTSYRMLTASAEHGGAVQVLRPLSERDGVLAGLRWKILIAGLVVVLAAAITGWLLARRITRRLTRLAQAAVQVAESGRLDVAVPISGRDEVSQVASAFHEMLDALRRSELAQRRLVQDAGHELRTPLTSLRTNLDLLERYPDLGPDQRRTVIADLHGESRELSALVNELVEITSGEASSAPPERVQLSDLIDGVVARAVRRTGRRITVDADTSEVIGQRGGLERAVGNLIDNALKFSPETEPVQVTAVGGRVEVRDHGPGVSDGDLPRIFDRFYRSDEARWLPGSGLGLAIVHDVATSHGGTVFAGNHSESGAVIGFAIPPAG